MFKQRGFRNGNRHSSVQGFSRVGFLVRIFLYGGVAASLMLLWQVGLIEQRSSKTSDNDEGGLEGMTAKEDKALLARSLDAQKLHYRTHDNVFQVPKQAGSREAGAEPPGQKIWTALDTGPFQAIDGQVFPPNFRKGVIITAEARRQNGYHYIGAVFVAPNGELMTQGCRAYFALDPSKMTWVGDAGAERIQCPDGAEPIDGL